MQKKIIHHITKILVSILNFIFASITIGLTAIALFKPEWIELFIEWMGRQINMLGNHAHIVL